MRAAIAQAKRGEDINVDPFFDLMDPVKRPTAIEQLSRQSQPQPDPLLGLSVLRRSNRLNVRHVKMPIL